MIDVPFDQYIGNDEMDLHDNTCIAVGDFATAGIVFSDDENPTELPCPGNCLHPYILSIEALRKKPSMYSFIPRLKLDSMYSIKQTRLKLEVVDIDFFYQRYDEAAAMDFVPECHGDTFTARSSNNIILGDYLNVATLGFVFSGTGVMNKIYTYSEPYNNYEWVSDPVISLSSTAQYNGRIVSWAADTVNVIGSAVPQWQSQKVVDVVNGPVAMIDFSSDFIEGAVRRIFFEDGVAAQMTQDMYRFAVSYETGRSPALGTVCSAADSSMIPLDTETDYAITNILDPISEGLTPSPTVTAMPSSSLDPRPWYPLFSDSSCRNDGNEEYFMEISIDVSAVVEKPMVEVANALSHALFNLFYSSCLCQQKTVVRNTLVGTYRDAGKGLSNQNGIPIQTLLAEQDVLMMGTSQTTSSDTTSIGLTLSSSAVHFTFPTMWKDALKRMTRRVLPRILVQMNLKRYTWIHTTKIFSLRLKLVIIPPTLYMTKHIVSMMGMRLRT